jgi:hypothetical protein
MQAHIYLQVFIVLASSEGCGTDATLAWKQLGKSFARNDSSWSDVALPGNNAPGLVEIPRMISYYSA